MQTDTIITTLLSAATFLKEPIRAIASQSLRDVYESTKYYLRRKFGPNSSATVALEAATENPQSPGRKLTLLEESAPAKLDSDADLVRLVHMLATLLGDLGVTPLPAISVTGNRGPVNVAGRDLITTTRHVVRNEVTPDASHLSAEQSAELRSVIGEVADRMADDSGAPNFAAVHRQLQRRFRVASYLLIPRDRFPDALALAIVKESSLASPFNEQSIWREFSQSISQPLALIVSSHQARSVGQRQRSTDIQKPVVAITPRRASSSASGWMGFGDRKPTLWPCSPWSGINPAS